MNLDQAMSRRHVLSGTALAGAGLLIPSTLSATSHNFSMPIGLQGRLPGDGFYIRHGFDCENTWFAPNWWHTGENWYLIEGDSAGAEVYAVTDGVVVFVGFDYPGPVVIVEHAEDLYSMYGHLAYDVPVSVGQEVARGEVLGWLLNRTDGRAPSHLHFETRNFLTNPVVNGKTPRYELGCGYDCPPGPGYWPMIDGALPVEYGWMNPMHVIAHNAGDASMVQVNANYAGESISIASQPSGKKSEHVVDSFKPEAGTPYELLDVRAAAVDTSETSSRAYHVWYEIGYRSKATGWVRSTRPSYLETGHDGRPSAIDVLFLTGT